MVSHMPPRFAGQHIQRMLSHVVRAVAFCLRFALPIKESVAAAAAAVAAAASMSFLAMSADMVCKGVCVICVACLQAAVGAAHWHSGPRGGCALARPPQPDLHGHRSTLSACTFSVSLPPCAGQHPLLVSTFCRDWLNLFDALCSVYSQC